MDNGVSENFTIKPAQQSSFIRTIYINQLVKFSGINLAFLTVRCNGGNLHAKILNDIHTDPVVIRDDCERLRRGNGWCDGANDYRNIRFYYPGIGWDRAALPLRFPAPATETSANQEAATLRKISCREALKEFFFFGPG